MNKEDLEKKTGMSIEDLASRVKKHHWEIITADHSKLNEKGRFEKNFYVGVFPFTEKCNGKSLTPIETILAKCAYCMIFETDEFVPDCQNQRKCPLYKFMATYDSTDYVFRELLQDSQPQGN